MMPAKSACTRGVLTVDLNCTKCNATGRVQWCEDRPGTVVRCGGGPIPQVRRERLCSCVCVESPKTLFVMAGDS